MTSNYKPINILLMNVHLDCVCVCVCFFFFWGGGNSSNRNASRDKAVETGDESVETRESIEAGKNTIIMLWLIGIPVEEFFPISIVDYVLLYFVHYHQ